MESLEPGFSRDDTTYLKLGMVSVEACMNPKDGWMLCAAGQGSSLVGRGKRRHSLVGRGGVELWLAVQTFGSAISALRGRSDHSLVFVGSNKKSLKIPLIFSHSVKEKILIIVLNHSIK